MPANRTLLINGEPTPVDTIRPDHGGETGTTAGPPALRNAIFAATGIALKRLPIDREVLAGGNKV
jgi:CO/xanthine dehydrogenase Mo-binding subunit